MRKEAARENKSTEWRKERMTKTIETIADTLYTLISISLLAHGFLNFANGNVLGGLLEAFTGGLMTVYKR